MKNGQMEDFGKVSVIMPCYNQSMYLNKTLECLLRQTYLFWECIVVDDGSTDNSFEIARSFAEQDSRIQVVTKNNGGSASARNLGLQLATGDYIQFLDADDLLDSAKFQRQLEFMKVHKLDVSYTDYSYFSDDNALIPLCQGSKLSLFNLLCFWGITVSMSLHSFMYRADFLKKNRLKFGTRFRQREDWNFHLAVFKQNPFVGRIRGYVGAWYRTNPEGKTGSYMKVQEGNFRFLIDKRFELPFFEQVLWTFRLSEEIWQCLMRMLKHKSWNAGKLFVMFFKNKISTVFFLLFALLLLPLSVFVIIYRFVMYYLLKKK